MRITRLILAGSLIVTLLVLVAQNLRVVGLHFITWELALPIALPIAAAYLLGAWTGGLVFNVLKALRPKARPPATPRARQ